MVNPIICVFVGSIIFLVLILLFRKKIKKAWFKLSFFSAGIETHEQSSSVMQGGNGGNATVGGNGIATGGNGGTSGLGGAGGNGGNANVIGNGDAFAGHGGDAGKESWQGGKGGESAIKNMGLPNIHLSDGTHLWDRGKGGDGGDGAH